MERAQFWFNLCQPIIRAFKLLAFRSFELLYSTSLDFELQLQWKLLDLFIWANSSVLLSLPKVCLGKLFPSFNFWLIITTGNIKRLWMYFVGISKTSSHKIIIKWIKLRLRPAVNLKCESEWHSNVDFFIRFPSRLWNLHSSPCKTARTKKLKFVNFFVVRFALPLRLKWNRTFPLAHFLYFYFYYIIRSAIYHQLPKVITVGYEMFVLLSQVRKEMGWGIVPKLGWF